MNLNSKEIDWLQISRLGPCHSQSILELSHILTGRTISQGMFQRLPKSYLSRLLRAIKQSLLTVDKNNCLIAEILQDKGAEREELIEVARRKQALLMQSKAKLIAQHEQLKSKSQLLKALQKKIKHRQAATKQRLKQQPAEIYYCPYCRRSDYKDRIEFEKHMSEAHISADNNNNKMQNFILELKDKELAIMEMVMKKNDQMNQAAKTLLDREMKLLTAGFQEKYQQKQTKIENCEEGELMTESEYLQFQNENVSTENKPIFWSTKDISEKYKPKPISHTKELHIMPSLYNDREEKTNMYDKKHSMAESSKKYLMKQDTKQIIPLTDLNQSAFAFANQSIYKSHSVETQRMAYHSGPLIDDEGSGSDIQDYFFKKPHVPIVVDEEIQIDSRLLARLGEENSENLEISKSNTSKIRLPSQLLSADDSVEDRDFSLSKDESQINLSDLRYSKVLKRQQNKQKAELFPVEQEPMSTQKSSYLSNFIEQRQPNRIETVEPKTTRQHDILSEFYSSQDNTRKCAKTEKSLQPPRKMKKTQISLAQIKQQLIQQSIYS